MVLDTLEILIEADRSGLESQLKSANNTIVQFVSDMNNQQINWEQILSKSVTPALLATIASTFAIAITQALQFQQAATNMSNNVNTSVSSGFGDASDSVSSMALQTGESATDLETATQQFIKLGFNSADALSAAGDASEIAFAQHTDLSTVMQQLVPLFDQWGVTTLPAAEDAMTGLANAASEGKFSFGELTDIISGASKSMQGDTTINQLSTQLQALSNVSGTTKQSVTEMFNDLSNAATAPNTNLLSLMATGGKINQVLSGPDGLIQGFQDVANKIKDFGGNAQIAGQVLGISTTLADTWGKTTTQAFTDAKAANDKYQASELTLQDIEAKNQTVITTLQQNFNRLITTLSKFVIPSGLSQLSTLLADISYLVDLINTPMKTLSETISGIKDEGVGTLLGDIAGGFAQLGNDLTFGLAGKAGSAVTGALLNTNSTGLGSGLTNSIASLILNQINSAYANSNPGAGGAGNTTNINVNVANPTGDPAVAGNKVASSVAAATPKNAAR